MQHPTARVKIGTRASKTVVVTRNLTVAHFFDHMPEVYGTPMMIYLMEVAAARAVDPCLPLGWVSVGVSVEIEHLAPTPIGFEVTATAEVLSVAHDAVALRVTAHDGVEEIGRGSHTRAPVELARLQRRISAKTAARLGTGAS